MGLALAFGLGDLDSVVVALAGFLLRGGIVLLALPSVVLPSVIGIAGVTGVDAFGIDGRPTTVALRDGGDRRRRGAGLAGAGQLRRLDSSTSG